MTCASELVKKANIVPLPKLASDVWRYFGFKTNNGTITNGDQVCNC